MKMIYDEWYGNLSYAQRAAYRKHNVTPAEHDMLVARYGESAHAAITQAVKRSIGTHGMFDIRLALGGA